MAEKYADQGVVVLGFNCSDDPELAKDFMKECGFRFRTVLDGSQAAQTASWADYRACCVPLHYIIDRERKIALAQPGFEAGYGKILGTLARLGVDTGVAPLPAPEIVRKPRAGEETAAIAGPPVRGQAAISGRVVGADGEPLEGMSIRLLSEGTAVRKAALTDADGRFTFRRLPAAKFKIVWERDPQDEGKDVVKEVLLEEGQEIEVEFKPGG